MLEPDHATRAATGSADGVARLVCATAFACERGGGEAVRGGTTACKGARGGGEAVRPATTRGVNGEGRLSSHALRGAGGAV